MQYHQLGGSGLQVARIGLGCIPFGSTIDEEASRLMVDRYLDASGNYLDTANVYGGGMRGSHERDAGTSERTVGAVVAGRRNRFVIGTKGAWTMTDQVRPNGFGLSRTYLTRAIDASLRRLGSDYIDLYQCHVWDPYTPIEETMRVLDDAVRAGKIRYVGVSNWGGWQVVKANMHAHRYGLTPIVSNQIWYNLADRTAEFALIPACRDQDVSIMVWGAYAQGFLTGRYTRDMDRAAARIAHHLQQARGVQLLGAAGGRPGVGHAGGHARHGRPPRAVAGQRRHGVASAERPLRRGAAGRVRSRAARRRPGRAGADARRRRPGRARPREPAAGAVPDEFLEHLLLPRQRVLRRPAVEAIPLARRPSPGDRSPHRRIRGRRRGGGRRRQ